MEVQSTYTNYVSVYITITIALVSSDDDITVARTFFIGSDLQQSCFVLDESWYVPIYIYR